MNTLMLVVLAVVALCYCGGKYCPKVLSSNKEMLLGVLVGLALCSFTGLKLEGFDAIKFTEAGCCDMERQSDSDCIELAGMDGNHHISDVPAIMENINKRCQEYGGN